MNQDIISRQIEREEAQVRMGLERAVRRDERALSVGEQTRLERLTLSALLPAARDHLASQLASYVPGKGRRPAWCSVLEELDLDTVAAQAISSVFRSAMKRHTLQTALTALAKPLEVLVIHTRLARAAESRKDKERLARLTKARTTIHGRRKAILKAGQQPADAEAHKAWTVEEAVIMAQPLLNAALAGPLFVLVEHKGAAGESGYALQLSEDGELAAKEVSDLGLLARPLLRPMLSKPRDWEGLRTGAYVTEPVSTHVPLVRTVCKSHKAMLEASVSQGTLAPVMQAVNDIQGVPLRISQDVLALREWCWDVGLHIEDVTPLRTPVEVPEVPEDLEQRPVKAQRRFWSGRRQAQRVNEGIAPNVVAYRMVTDEARDLVKEPRFYLPASLDFRGRVYPVSFMSHHQGDATKALFEFARGEALGDEGLAWLMIHTANCGDFDKVSKKTFQDRVDWCEDNEELIRAVAGDPQVNRQWTQADAPFSFYAACRDLVRAWDSPDPATYVSHLPIALDGSNSGVQHYSAAMRAPEGRYVNLMPTGRVEDLYRTVAEACQALCAKAETLSRRKLEGKDILAMVDGLNDDIEAIQAPVKADPTGKLRLNATEKRKVRELKSRRDFLCAVLWARTGVSRSIVKRSVMTFGYSSVAFGFAQQLRDDFMAPLTLKVLKGDLEKHPFGQDEGRAAAGVLGRLIYASVVKVLPYVAKAMEWLQHTAGVLAGDGKGVLLVTPLGFPMLMKVTETEVKRANLLLLDRTVPVGEHNPQHDRVVNGSVLRRVQASVQVGGTKVILPHKQRSGVAPNVIHSMDACHLQLVTLECKARGIPDLLLIHDSFATHAGRTGELSAVLRETLVDLYSNYDPLQDIYDRALAILGDDHKGLLAPPPAKGDLDLAQVLDAEYAFS